VPTVELETWGHRLGRTARVAFPAVLVTAVATGCLAWVSKPPDGSAPTGSSGGAALSADGRYVAFNSEASNLVAGDTNGTNDVFVHDRTTGTTTRVSVGAEGAQANGYTYYPSISANGRYVAFFSEASNLVAGDTNEAHDVFVHDRTSGATTRVSVGAGEAEANGFSQEPSLSEDGRYVAFGSSASNLVADDTNGMRDIFVYDRTAGTTTLVSVGSDGAQANFYAYAPSISGDGRFVAFYSSASNLVAGDTNDERDVFVHDRTTGITTRVSVGAGGVQAHSSSAYPAISGDGRFVAFHSSASNLVAGDNNRTTDVFVHDRTTGTTTRVSVGAGGVQASGGSVFPSISADGRYVAFHSLASNLVDGDTNNTEDVFVHDRTTGTTTRVSVGAGGIEANDRSEEAAMSPDGHVVAFGSSATNLLPDGLGVLDQSNVFVKELSGG
jgi:Tol biopolymer transport system component